MTQCRCKHDSDLHVLDDICLTEGPDRDHARLMWRFTCLGVVREVWPCSCNNFELVEGRKEVTW